MGDIESDTFRQHQEPPECNCADRGWHGEHHDTMCPANPDNMTCPTCGGAGCVDKSYDKPAWWPEHATWTRADWREEVAADNTLLGYREWVEHRWEESQYEKENRQAREMANPPPPGPADAKPPLGLEDVPPLCRRCKKPVKLNVPRMGPSGGWVHVENNSPLCPGST